MNSVVEDRGSVGTPSRRPTDRRWVIWCAAAGIIALLGALVRARTLLPWGHWEDRLVGRPGKDEIHFVAHALIGAALNQLGLAPDLAGREWLVAAAHVRTPTQSDEAVNGLSEAQAHSTSARRFVAAVCAEGYGRRQIPIMRRAGLQCLPPSPTNSP